MAETAIEIQTETQPAPPDPQTPEPSPEGQEDVRPDPVAERIGELTGTVEGLRSITQTQQAELARLRMQSAPQPQIKPEYESHEYTRYLDQRYGQAFQQLQGANAHLLNQNDLLTARLSIDDTYGSGTFKKYSKQVEDAFQAALAQGAPQSRERLFYQLATERNWKLTPQEERDAAETRTTRRRSAQSATISATPPARKADTPAPEKPMSAMNKQERDAALQKYIDQHGGF